MICTTQQAKKKPFKGIQLHHLIIFPMIERHSSFDIETIINSDYGKRNSRFYKLDHVIFEGVLKDLKASEKFKSSQILHKSSDLGLPYQLVTVFDDGTIISFDGMLIRATKNIHSQEFGISEILELTGYPDTVSAPVREFMEIAKKSTTDELYFGTNFHNYYTFNEIFWEQLPIKREGEPQCSLLIKDPHMFTVCGDQCTQGLFFNVYLGNNDWIHQMVANDLLLANEISSISGFFYKRKKNVLEIQQNIESYYEIITFKHVVDIVGKYRAWERCKKDLVDLFKIGNHVQKGLFYYEKIENPIKNKFSFRNTEIQMWPTDNPPDPEERNQTIYKQFFRLEIEENSLKVNDDSMIAPLYYSSGMSLQTKLVDINKKIDDVYLRIRDVLLIFQTEFALYAVIFAIIAIIIMILQPLFSPVISIIFEFAKSVFNQIQSIFTFIT